MSSHRRSAVDDEDAEDDERIALTDAIARGCLTGARQKSDAMRI